MKKGKWNYTENIDYRVVIVRIEATPNKMHWQNAFMGEMREVVEIISRRPRETPYTFYIDNADGSGLLKIARGGGPDSMSRHLDVENIYVQSAVDPDKWQHWDVGKCLAIDQEVDEYQKKADPEKYAELEALKAAWLVSPMNPKNVMP